MATLIDATKTKACREMLRKWTFSIPIEVYLRWLWGRDRAAVRGAVKAWGS